MTGFISPDIPAYWTYSIVLFLGALVAIDTVNSLLGSESDRWAFPSTWLLFIAHAFLPCILFWFLDYTGALSDTSIFAALVVAFGYRQIFAGGIQGITMPGQTPMLWKPFEAWVTRLVGRIRDRNKLYRDRFDEAVQMSIAADPQRLTSFERLVLTHSNNPQSLNQAVLALPTTGNQDADTRRKIDLMWRDLRQSRSDMYGWLLFKARLVRGWRYWIWLSKGRAKLITAGVVCVLSLALVGGVAWLTSDDLGGTRQHVAWLQYHKWRFLRANATERDRWRSREFITNELRDWGERQLPSLTATTAALKDAQTQLAEAGRRLETAKADSSIWKQAKADADAAAKAIQSARETERRTTAAKILLRGLIDELRFPGLAQSRVGDIVGILLNCHSPALNAAHVPDLIETLRVQNEVVRREVRNALLALKADYPGAEVPKELENWQPRKEESSGDIDRIVRRWQAWWGGIRTKHP